VEGSQNFSTSLLKVPFLLNIAFVCPDSFLAPFNYNMSCRYPALTPHWRRGFLTGFYSKDQSGENLMARGQNCGVRPAFVKELI
jgi:hypothetical protein